MKITIPLYRVERYIELAQEYLQPNYWNEVVGTGWVFIFDDGVVAWRSLEDGVHILAHCQE